MAKLSEFMYGMIVVIGVFAVMFGFASSAIQTYEVPVPAEYNESFAALSNMTAINEQTADFKESTFKEDPNATSGFFGRLEEKFDIVGLYLGSGIKTIKLFPRTIKVFNSMVNNILDQGSQLFGSSIAAIRFIIVSLVLVAAVVAIVSVLVKWWV